MCKRVCKDDQIRLIMECRQSGLSDYQWCKQNDIQEVVKIDLIQPQDSSLKVDHNVSLVEQTDSSTVAAELLVGGVTLRLFNGAEEN